MSRQRELAEITTLREAAVGIMRHLHTTGIITGGLLDLMMPQSADSDTDTDFDGDDNNDGDASHEKPASPIIDLID